MKKKRNGYAHFAAAIVVAVSRALFHHRKRSKPTLGPADSRSFGSAPAPRVRPASPLSEVRFGHEGAKKARHKRTMARIGAVALGAALLGVPGINFGIDLLDARFSSPSSAVGPADLGGVTTSETAKGLMRMRGDLFQSRPTPTPTPTEVAELAEPEAAPVAVPSGSVSEILYAAAAEFGIDGAYLASVASCESGLNPGAVNPAGYHGLFQFSESTWAAYGYGSIYDPVAQGRTAARMLAAGLASHWPNCA